MYIVTGGAGFIGSALVWTLNSRGIDDILIVDTPGDPLKEKNLTPLNFKDFIEKKEFRKRLKSGLIKSSGIDTVIHLGACSNTTETDAAYLLDNNFNYSVDLGLFTAENSIRYIYASSAATYGDGAQGYNDDESKIDSLQPLNLYGYSKQLFDQFALKTGLLKKAAGLKFTNVFGPNEWHKGPMRSLVCKAYEQIKETGKLKLFKSHKPEFRDGEQMRDFLYIKDAVKMVLFFIDHPEINGIYNIGSGKAETWNTLASAIFAGMNLPENIEYIDMPAELQGKYQYYTKAEMGKLQSAGYTTAPMPLKDAVIDYVKKHLIPDCHLGEG